MSQIFRSTSLKRSRLKRKPAKRRPGDVDRNYVAWIKTLPCDVPGCSSSPTPRADWNTIVEAHHAGDHGLSQRAPDRTCIPLCAWHHRVGQLAIHGPLGKSFWDFHRIDRDRIIAEHNARYDSEH